MSDSETKELFIANPDVVVREEDADGALLFNPDTNDVKIVNQTGLCILKACSVASTLDTICEAVRSEFSDIPDKNLASDTEKFLQALIHSEFVGRV